VSNRFIGTPAPLTRPRARALSSKTAYSNEKLLRLGVNLRYGYREGLARTVRWYQLAGKI